MTIDIAKPDLIRPKKVSDFSTQNITETQLEYFYRIGKSEKQIQVNNFTDNSNMAEEKGEYGCHPSN